MNELAERAKAIVSTRNNKCWNDYCGGGSACPDCEVFKVELIEQALLRERRLAMEEAAKMVEDSSCKDHGADCMLPARKKRNEIAAKLRAAAEKEVGE